MNKILNHESIINLIKKINSLGKEIRYIGEYYTRPYSYERFQTRKVKIGNIYVGGDSPIVIQSMTTTSTLDIEATVQQTIELYEKGCEVIRITAKNPKEAKALKEIKKILNEKGYNPPIVADIHFSPQTALIAAESVDKVRINPGNFADTKTFTSREYTDEEYEKEILKIHDAFVPLVKKLKEYGKSLRIGCNHGSLSDRIMNRYGDTPEGMVESVIEYIKIAEYYDYHDIVVSMKASNPYVMIQAYRMLVERFKKEEMNYPLHLGVTEAGDDKDGRLKSFAGIGILLLEGIGDTIRVSLTEDPIYEIDAAREIINIIEKAKEKNQNVYDALKEYEFNFKSIPYEIKRLKNHNLENEKVGHSHSVKWILRYHKDEPLSLKDFDENYPDYFLVDEADIHHFEGYKKQFPETIKTIYKINKTSLHSHFERVWIDIHQNELLNFVLPEKSMIIVNIIGNSNIDPFAIRQFIELNKNKNLILSFSFESKKNHFADIFHIYRYFNFKYQKPLCLNLNLNPLTEDTVLSYVGIWGGSLLYTGLGDLIFIDSQSMKKSFDLGSDILQITRLRLSRADFISCPSCGRTLFNLQETTQKIKALTKHLKGVKIGIMGCIVNGLGEMADADFGYVGSSPGMVNLYKGKELIRRNVPEEEAPNELVNLIKEYGMWKEKN